ncbi:nucleotidyl transferase AbiEii/AbiGii toxin family protein [Candidatus Wolfebacteria bacterium]|nr:nucleotidyl transferase AbiEii/AbiGii toxin family protein [Candidatus Wolfebacteria bacterium]
MGASSKKQIVWRADILPRETKKALDFLSGQKWLDKSFWYLAGGTALALQFGNCKSVDLDFFTSRKKFNNTELLGKFLKNKNWKININKENTIYGELFGAKASFIAYPFFKPSQRFLRYGFINVIQPVDIAVMKIIAVSQGGRKRDFFDLYWCAKNIEPLNKTVKRLKTQYPLVAHDYHHILKSLVYFRDAESDPMPKIYFGASWREVKKFFMKEVPLIAGEIIKLN